MPIADSFPVAVKDAPQSNYKMVNWVYKLVDGLNANAGTFDNPDPTIAELKKSADDLSAGNTKARHGTPEDTAARDAARKVCDRLADRFVIYVRTTVHTKAVDAADATRLILAVGLAIKTVTPRHKAELAATYDRVTGDVALVARAVGREAMYFWEVSADNQKTWTPCGQGMVANMRVPNLTPGQTYAFRFRAQDRRGMGDYSAVVTLTLH